jgi:iron complex transport system ATP-binding protein
MSFSTRELTVRYRPELPPALSGVSIEIPEGSLYAVLGPNGSGKSTLMRALLGVLSPHAGQASFEGRNVREWGRRELARAIGAVPQTETIVFPLSVRELVAMGRYPHLGAVRSEGEEDREAVVRAMEECDAGHLSERDVGTLSGGEFQRIRIARALAQRPRALVLDEPTASLDLRHEMEILQLLRRSADAGRTVVLITHHLDAAARFADQILLLRRGTVAAEGAPVEVMREENLQAVYEWRVAVRPDPITGHPRVTALDQGGIESP